MTAPIPAISAETFEQEVLKADRLVLIAFKADWAGPSKAMMQTLAEYAPKNPGVKIVSIDIDREGKLAQDFGIQSVPTVVTMHSGEALHGAVGNQPEGVLDKLLEESRKAVARRPAVTLPPTERRIKVMKPLALGAKRMDSIQPPRGIFGFRAKPASASPEDANPMKPLKLKAKRKPLSFGGLFS